MATDPVGSEGGWWCLRGSPGVPEGVMFCVCPEGLLGLSSGLGVLLPECLGCLCEVSEPPYV